jgi:membrane protein implicated in regulation of membrane protease activity
MIYFWLIVAVLAIVCEMLSGTLYLLVIGLAAACAALLAWFDQSLVLQLFAAALLALLGGLLVRKYRSPARADMAADLHGKAEVASIVAPGRLRVRWRGTEWEAECAAGAGLVPGDAVSILSQQGNVLQVVAFVPTQQQ